MGQRADLGQGNVRKLLFSLSVPTITSQIVNMLYNLVDRVFIGHMQPAETVGKLALTGVGVCLPIIMVISAFASLMAIGGAPRASIAEGAGESEKSERIMGNCLSMLLITSLVLTVLFEVFAERLLLLFGASENTVVYALDYMRIYVLGTVFVQLTLGMNAYITAQGFATVSMKTVLIGALLNTALDPLFIFVLDMGVSGAALATILSQIVSFCLLLRGCTRGGNIAISLKNFSPSWARYKEIARGGTPSLFRQGLGSVATICLNFAAGIYGDAAIAGMSIVTRVLQFANSAIIGLGQGFQPVCGFNYGAKLYGRVRKAFWFTVSLAFCVLLIGSIVGIAFAPQIIEIFRKEDLEVIKIGALSLRLQCIFLPLSAFVVGSNMMLQTIGKPVKASISAAARTGLFFVPAILILPQFFGLLGVQMSQAVADLCSFVLCVPLAGTTLLEMKRLEKERAEV